jgi:hypothetical protein
MPSPTLLEPLHGLVSLCGGDVPGVEGAEAAQVEEQQGPVVCQRAGYGVPARLQLCQVPQHTQLRQLTQLRGKGNQG